MQDVPFVVIGVKVSLEEYCSHEKISWLFCLEKLKAVFLYEPIPTHWPVELEGILSQLANQAPNFQGLLVLTATRGVCHVPSVAYLGSSYSP